MALINSSPVSLNLDLSPFPYTVRFFPDFWVGSTQIYPDKARPSASNFIGCRLYSLTGLLIPPQTTTTQPVRSETVVVVKKAKCKSTKTLENVEVQTFLSIVAKVLLQRQLDKQQTNTLRDFGETGCLRVHAQNDIIGVSTTPT